MAVNEELIAPCGIRCEACPVYRARTDEALRRSLAEKAGVPEAFMRCDGCRPTQGSPMPLRGKVCPTYACAEQNGVTYCHACASFPCRRLHPSAQRADALPHNTKLYSLLVMRRDGLEAWAAQYDAIQRRYFQAGFVIGHGPRLPEDETEDTPED